MKEGRISFVTWGLMAVIGSTIVYVMYLAADRPLAREETIVLWCACLAWILFVDAKIDSLSMPGILPGIFSYWMPMAYVAIGGLAFMAWAYNLIFN